jgi:hypothetical protein
MPHHCSDLSALGSRSGQPTLAPQPEARKVSALMCTRVDRRLRDLPKRGRSAVATPETMASLEFQSFRDTPSGLVNARCRRGPHGCGARPVRKRSTTQPAMKVARKRPLREHIQCVRQPLHGVTGPALDLFDLCYTTVANSHPRRKNAG